MTRRTPGDSSAPVSPRGLAGRFADGVSRVRVSSTDVRRPASFRSTRSSLMETSGSPSLPDLSGGFASRRQRAPSAPRAVALLSSFFPSLVENPTAGIQDAVTHFEDVPTWDRRMMSSPRVLRKDCRINRSRERRGAAQATSGEGSLGVFQSTRVRSTCIQSICIQSTCVRSTCIQSTSSKLKMGSGFAFKLVTLPRSY